MEFLAQFLGISIATLCILATQMKKKWQMMFLSATANLLAGINYLVFVGFSNAFMVSMVAVVQTTLDMFKSLKGKETSKAEKIIYLVLYLTFGVLGVKKLADWLIILASLTFCLSVFCKKEQGVRAFMVGNAATNVVYTILVNSTTLYSQIFSLISGVIALIRYRKKD